MKTYRLPQTELEASSVILGLMRIPSLTDAEILRSVEVTIREQLLPALPDDQPETLQLLTRHAYAFVQDTRVQGRFDRAASAVETTFSATVQVMEGPDNGPLLGLYPHHWHDNASVAGRLGPAYDTVRGPLKLLAASSFTVTG